MNHTAWIFICLPLVIGLGCASSRISKVPTEPNSLQKKPDISIDNAVSEVEPNIPNEPTTFVLSGSLGVGNAVLKGLPGDPNTQANGTYHITMTKGWSGVVTPEKEGFTFLPASRDYAPFTQDIFHEIYVPQKMTSNLPAQEPSTAQSDSQSLTGTLKLNGDPVPGITLRTIATSTTAVTDANGCFVLQVPSGWAGTLRLDTPEPGKTAPGTTGNTFGLMRGTPARQSDCAPEPNIPFVSEVPAPETPAPEESLITLGISCLSPKATEELRHDLRVMCRLLGEQARGLSLVNRDPQNEPKAIYLPGDGVLFDIGIEWPLSGQPSEPKASDQSIQWQRASDYVDRCYEPTDVLDKLHRIKTQAYLQKMTDSLVHASHIRHLGADSSITLHIWGPSPSKDCLIRTDKKAIDDYAKAVLTDHAFQEQVTLKLH